VPPGAGPGGWGVWGRAAAQWAVGRPALYGIPASIPALRLGETVYHEPHEPGAISTAAARLVAFALARADSDRAARAGIADRLRSILNGGDGPGRGSVRVRAIRPIAGAVSGELRLPVLRDDTDIGLATSGVVRSYPRSLDMEPAARTLVWPGEPACLGARAVCDTLWTLPTHDMVTEQDIEAISAWAHVRA
jgi:hypothetical protein